MLITRPPRRSAKNGHRSAPRGKRLIIRATRQDAPQAARALPAGHFRTKGQTHEKDIPRLHDHRRRSRILQNRARIDTAHDPKELPTCDVEHEGKRARARLFCTQARGFVVCFQPNASPIFASKPYRRKPGEQSGGQPRMVQRAHECPARPRATPSQNPRPNGPQWGAGTVNRLARWAQGLVC